MQPVSFQLLGIPLRSFARSAVVRHCAESYRRIGTVASLAMTPEQPVYLIRRRQLSLPGIAWAGLRNQPLQLRNAGAAIGARFQFCPDVRGRTRAACDGIAVS